MLPDPDPAPLLLDDQIEAALARSTALADGLVAAIAQERASRAVLMLAWMDRDALRLTLSTGWATYYSRSRGRLWRKGETSGHLQRVHEVRWDCDADALLLTVTQTGPACHTGTRTCFDDGMIAHAD